VPSRERGEKLGRGMVKLTRGREEREIHKIPVELYQLDRSVKIAPVRELSVLCTGNRSVSPFTSHF
jgi:hypothetical protein